MKKLFILFVILAVASLFIGVQHISLADLLMLKADDVEVLIISRIPRLISIIIAGASMSICGLIMQQLSQNKFVSPTTAGTMDCARLGILVSLILFASAGPLLKVTIAFLFAFAGTMIFMRILEKVKYKDAIFIPLVGLMFGNIISSMTTFFAYKYNLIQSISSWLHGDFSMIIKGRYELLYLSVPLMIVAYMYANRFTIAGMGEEIATNLGLHYRSIVNVGLIIVAATSSVVVLTVGTLPFLGLIIPNLVTLYYGDHLEKVLPLTALSGAIFVLACDIFGRVVIYPYEIPIGLTVGVIGSGVFLYLLVRRRKQYV
ncbi:ABC transporter permease [Parageobacillus thermoglucosidasius]|uniref:Iron ABC transporter permease n=1 Tax=Parageobacillus thermoglucosidasius TaxID=1426 RepID=A0AAN1D5D4_PARTM|nr:ABC transporter permease [Parageobacillus thermoglucosidasius]AEH46557.1 ABC-type transporter, integral membrane subunit [Parageobacillus thermoglucosidasius C56-YS93]ALF08642.1 iron ABC transporter permease [Parageobacillus thermoglucosidasius]ANZ28726.1 iron ABC transporter permease [Parageobacillus thermoglucosidasius]APM79463.1 iron ABC transporter permease [Parageobacillus thermoglucosidasius]KJX68673.1 iron ABC transporter permease [Parageobacillus thermoglucosidasius]